MSKTTVDDLLALIAWEITANPVQCNGSLWAGLSQPMLALNLGVSVETLRRLISKPPIVRRTTKLNGKNVTLLRVGEPGPMTPDDIAKEMSRIWNGHRKAYRAKWQEESEALVGSLDMLHFSAIGMNLKRAKRLEKLIALPRHTTRREFGCMIGLAGAWPEGHQIELFKMVLKRWPTFMAGVKWAAVVEAHTAGEMDEQVFSRHLEFPSLAVIRRFAHVAIEIATMDVQEKGKAPAWIKALTPGIWPKAKTVTE